MRITKKEYEERLELIKMAVEEGAKSKKEICEKTGYSMFVVNNTLKEFTGDAKKIQTKMKKAATKKATQKKGSKSKGEKTVDTTQKAENKETAKKEKQPQSNNKEKIAVLDISMLNVKNVTEILDDYMKKETKIAVSNTTIYQISSNREKKNENGEKSARTKRAEELLDFLQKRKEQMKPILITGEQSMEALMLACKKLQNECDVIILSGNQIVDLIAWTFGIKSQYFPKEEIYTCGCEFSEQNSEETKTMPIESIPEVMQKDATVEDIAEESIEIPMFRDNISSLIKTLPETSLKGGKLYIYNEFELLQVKTYRGEEKDVSSIVELEKGDLVFIATKKQDCLILEYYRIEEISIRNHAKRLYRKTINSFDPTTHTINNPEFKRFADKAVKKVFGK